ncbi:hypothetical protein EXIGLDRAFT_762278 [Exidia glandulosa HHB12029]|uniref:DDE Tnp4 domain-containing protein n=1 Tax=Exidia glandulosa HHB12029 TaxID=1314781 RepID=A0A165MVA8_EXIGL|nr:hypothetical protein EXIGLDRAFT_762278 [Exidia glandulosa HHB12029]
MSVNETNWNLNRATLDVLHEGLCNVHALATDIGSAVNNHTTILGNIISELDMFRFKTAVSIAEVTKFKEQFRFSKADVERLVDHLDLPARVHGDNNCSAPAAEALLMLLRCLSEPARLSDIELSFGWERTRLSRIARATVFFLYKRWKHILYFDADCLTGDKLTEFALAVEAQGAPLTNCVAMLDGRRRKCCRPSRNQRLLFNGWCRYCCLAYHTLTTPDGIHVHVFGPIKGRRHDWTIFKESGLPDLLRRHFDDSAGNAMVIYGDPAYGLSPHLISPFLGDNLP